MSTVGLQMAMAENEGQRVQDPYGGSALVVDIVADNNTVYSVV
jgi:hypothetical protein